MSEARYKAFISYSHDDDKWADWLHRALESYRLPKRLIGEITEYGPIPKKLAPVFRDRAELSTATELGDVLTEAINDSACQIVICSPSAARSHWVNEEILAFKRSGREHRIFCLIVGGEPNANGRPGLEECFPEALRFKLGADGELSDRVSEPIAADVRPGKDGKSDAKLKIISGMLGVSFDALKQREAQRRHRRMAIVATAATIGMVITSALATVAVLARAEAERQRVRAEAEALTAQQTADFLVELFAVSDPSEALGNTITAREILDQGARRIEFELQDQPAIKSTLLDTMGTVYMRLGLYDEAYSLLNRGLETRRGLFGERNPAVARSQIHLGELLGLQAEFEQAADLYVQAIAFQRESADASGAADVALSLVGLADIRVLQGDFEQAERLLREAADIQFEVLGPESMEVAKTLDALGMCLWDQGKYDDAEPLLRDALAMRRKLVPGGVHPDLDDSLNNLAVFLFEAGRYEQTESLFQESLEMKKRLLGDSHPEVATGLNNLAFAQSNAGEYDEAESNYLAALFIRRMNFNQYHPLIAQSLNNLAFLYYDTGDIQRALDLSREALGVYKSAYTGEHPDVAYGMQNLAGWLVEAGNYEEAEPLLREALAMNESLYEPGHPDIAITQTGMAILLLRTGRPDEALDMATRAEESLIAAYEEGHWRIAWAAAAKGAALTQLARYTDAETVLLASYEDLRNSPGARPVHIQTAKDYLVELYRAWGRPQQAERFLAE